MISGEMKVKQYKYKAQQQKIFNCLDLKINVTDRHSGLPQANSLHP